MASYAEAAGIDETPSEEGFIAMPSTRSAAAAAIVLAAGKSTRMKSDLPKVLHELCGQPILAYVLEALREAGVARQMLVVGHKQELVRQSLADRPGVEFTLQAEQIGTGHAVQVCAEAFADYRGPLLVIAGDQPLVRGTLLSTMLDRLEATGAKALIASAVVEDPFGLGRIIRDEQGDFLGIVEQKDATAEQAGICEINPSFYAFDAELLFAALAEVEPNNAQGEFYLTDVPAILRRQGHKVVAEPLADAVDMWGINHRQHLAKAHELMQSRIQNRLLDQGVTIVDPRNTYVDARAEIGLDSVILPFTVIEGPSQIGPGCRVGPFAHIRAGAHLAAGSVVGRTADHSAT